MVIFLLLKILDLLDRNTRDSKEKLIRSFDVEGLEVRSDRGWVPITAIHKTKAYRIYHLETSGGLTLDCADNHICYAPGYFGGLRTKYAKDFRIGDTIITETGAQKITENRILSAQISMVDLTVDSEDHRFYSNGILSHNTVTSSIFLLHFVLFNTDKNALVTGNKRKTAVEILEKSKSIFQELPFFLRAGVYKWNESKIVLDNGCMCMAEATTINSGISFTFHCVLADEFAHIPPNIKEEFYNNLFPVISAGRARFMITSTQNGPDLFCQLYTAAVNHENEYAPFKVDWWQVPEWDPDKKMFVPRDEEWHILQRGNFGGSEEKFQKQYGTEFIVSSDSLIEGRIITLNSVASKNFETQEIPGVTGAGYFFWKPGVEVQGLRNRFIICTIDISEGVKEDYTVCTFNEIKEVQEDGFVRTDTIGYFRVNDKDDKACCSILYNFWNAYLDPDRYIVSMEYNLYGELWMTNFKDIMEKDNPANFSQDNFVKYYNEAMTKWRCGVRMTVKSKQMACKLFKNSYERGYITNTSTAFISELRNFSDKNGNGTYSAAFGHDDMVMSQIQLELVRDSLQYKYLLERFSEFNPDLDNKEAINFYEMIPQDNPREIYQKDNRMDRSQYNKNLWDF